MIKVEFTRDELMWVLEAAAVAEEGMISERQARIEAGTWGEEERAALFTLIRVTDKLMGANKE